MMVESALPLKHISLVELITTERTGALETKMAHVLSEFNLHCKSVWANNFMVKKKRTVKCQRPQEQFGLNMRNDVKLGLSIDVYIFATSYMYLPCIPAF